ncbi:hypothetical protein [Streptomyces sp. NPDC059533]|uniref:hypothetical protein n=1 Tax=unclassified Streptomyces TaxID=2593676 RepID=UPI0036AA75D1
MFDASVVPAAPLYLLMIHPDEASGLALSIDGQQLAAGADIEELRKEGLAELTIRAALAGRPVRARAVEPDVPTPWLLVVSPDGTVTDVDEHPTAEERQEQPKAAPREAAPVPAPARTATTDNAAFALPDWPAQEHRDMWAAVWAAHAAGDLPTAVTLAYKLETTLGEHHGDMHPATVTVLTARAWLTLCQRTDRQGTAELLITTALRCRAARYRPEADTVRTARNAHATWHLLRKEDQEAAADLAAPLADMLAILGEDDRRKDVLAWERAAAASAG